MRFYTQEISPGPDIMTLALAWQHHTACLDDFILLKELYTASENTWAGADLSTHMRASDEP